MRVQRLGLAIAVCLSFGFTPSFAAEGPTIAGPIGGTDIRSAFLPPPGVYGGVIVVGAKAYDFLDGSGETIPALSTARLAKAFSGPFLFYVPDIKVFGGSIGIGAILPNGVQCGHLLAGEKRDCTTGIGDPYIEAAWSRAFGHLRPSAYPGALPIFEGLTTLVGIGAVVPLGQYDPKTPTSQALSIGTNVYDIAPSAALTYTTPAIIAEGTEFSAKIYYNHYLENPTTDYATGPIVNVDFAVSERIGRYQVGLAGSYVVQIADDELAGIPVPPDGRRVESLALGPVINYDMPELGASVKVKGLTTIHVENAVSFWGVSAGWVKKF